MSDRFRIRPWLYPVLWWLMAGGWGVVPAQPAPELYPMNEVVVTSHRVPMPFSQANRSMIVLQSSEIERLSVNTLQDLLNGLPGVDLRSRGAGGVQSDISIRGGGFDQVLVLVDGVRVNDPQTGHHHLNLPVAVSDIERIEIMKGPASGVYGADAYGGVIHIITRRNRDKSLSLHSAIGQHGWGEAGIHAAYPVGMSNHHLGINLNRSDGYRPHTQFEHYSFNYRPSIRHEAGNLNWLVGYDDHQFGANGFYGVDYPRQWEHIQTSLFQVGAEFRRSGWLILPKANRREKKDDYILDSDRPEWYRNRHTTDSRGAQLQFSRNHRFGTSSLGWEWMQDEISSTNLGDHTQTFYGVFAEHQSIRYRNISVNTNWMAGHYTGCGWEYCPSIDVGYQLNSSWRVFSSFSKAFRIPSFTERFYASPVSLGNSSLKPEQTIQYESGLSLYSERYSMGLALFLKNGTNTIDWLKTQVEDPWMACNITELRIRGFEYNLACFPSWGGQIGLNQIRLGYTYLQISKSSYGYLSRYLLDHLRHQVTISVTQTLFRHLELDWSLCYEKRLQYHEHWELDGGIRYPIGSCHLFIRGSNLLNRSGMDYSGIPLPGRWITIGIRYSVIGDLDS
ncbi:MAG: TonB-dependent receptor [Candidatus Delongbacteria bacterium]|nr:TonB-dependent receptor [Candidatus Delongbacteria bacterium]